MTDSEKLDLLLEKVGAIESKVSSIELTLENEIRTNSRIFRSPAVIFVQKNNIKTNQTYQI